MPALRHGKKLQFKAAARLWVNDTQNVCQAPGELPECSLAVEVLVKTTARGPPPP